MFQTQKVPFFCSCEPPGKNVHTGIWWTIFRLTTDMIFDLLTHLWPCQIWPEVRTEVQNLTLMSSVKLNHQPQKIYNVPIEALMCSLQINRWHWTPIIDLNDVNACFIHHLSNVKNYSISPKSETAQPKKRVLENIFYTFMPILGS